MSTWPVQKVLGNPNGVRVYIQHEAEPWKYDCAVVAMGFDAMSFAEYFKPVNASQPDDLSPLYPEGTRPDRFSTAYRDWLTHASMTIGPDLNTLSVAPHIYLPMLAGLKQGPGFPNLSCLGLLSDRVLRHSIRRLNTTEPEVNNV